MLFVFRLFEKSKVGATCEIRNYPEFMASTVYERRQRLANGERQWGLARIGAGAALCVIGVDSGAREQIESIMCDHAGGPSDLSASQSYEHHLI